MKCTKCGKYPFCKEIPKENCKDFVKINLEQSVKKIDRLERRDKK